jgi:hypothetical protein
MSNINTIRILRDLTLYGIMFGEAEALKVYEGQTLTGVLTVTKEGNGLIGLAYDEAVVVPAGAFEVVDAEMNTEATNDR